jgi:hypothetical protein
LPQRFTKTLLVSSSAPALQKAKTWLKTTRKNLQMKSPLAHKMKPPMMAYKIHKMKPPMMAHKMKPPMTTHKTHNIEPAMMALKMKSPMITHNTKPSMTPLKYTKMLFKKTAKSSAHQ